MSIVLSHPIGNANVRAALMGLNQAGLLSAFFTSIAVFEGSFLGKLKSFSQLRELERRQFDSSLKTKTTTYPFYETGRLLSSKLKLRSMLNHETGTFSIDAIMNMFDGYVAKKLQKEKRNGAKAIYSYEDAALLSFQQAKSIGLNTYYDLPIGYWRTARVLMESEKERWPEWVSTLTGFKDSEKKLAKKDEEIRLADEIFVASSFTANSLKDYPGTLNNITVVPYGFPPPNTHRKFNKISGRRIKILFVGGLSQRKGIADLFAAVNGLENYIELTIVGKKTGNPCIALDKALAKCTWIPTLSHGDILQTMQENDLFIFPSLFEGFGLVITEAMSQGTPVITTNRTAGPDLIDHGKNGWLVDAGCTQGLRTQIERLLNNPDQIINAGINALCTATARPWYKYGEELSAAIRLKEK